MGRITLITGGARSGKSAFAESLLEGRDAVLYVATAVGFDEEMRERIALHRSRRNPAWETLECRRGFAEILPWKIGGRDRILFDCVTLMVSNMMVIDSAIDWDDADRSAVAALGRDVMDEVKGLLKIFRDFSGETVVVTNELGMGIVPGTPLGRHYRDFAGSANQLIAAESDRVIFVVSGIPVTIKG